MVVTPFLLFLLIIAAVAAFGILKGFVSCFLRLGASLLGIFLIVWFLHLLFTL
ncbi:hypothetical protein KDA_76870 [Dictyobacter alpinus]|uniref:Uncharacterized protein n=1 Tax=Dictyobacter alpinus TaxID=2014873 RepID=A0A402BLG6_9CHLR|nr:hypothetical protein KDA_76870 [Dictyobacter alpinus]